MEDEKLQNLVDEDVTQSTQELVRRAKGRGKDSAKLVGGFHMHFQREIFKKVKDMQNWMDEFISSKHHGIHSLSDKW